MAVRPAPASALDTAPEVFALTPAVVAVTATLTWQDPLAVSPPPLRLIVVAPAEGANTPPQVFVAAGVAATCTPLGKVSVKPTPVRPARRWDW
ncbi:MAG: hypothetical protein U0531_16930 [Dehalococcoidia bacterium]